MLGKRKETRYQKLFSTDWELNQTTVFSKIKEENYIQFLGKMYFKFYIFQENIKNYLHLNGNKVDQRVELKHNDRVIIGTQGAFLIKIPGTAPRPDTPEEYNIDWEFAQKELTNELEKFKKDQEEALKK